MIQKTHMSGPFRIVFFSSTDFIVPLVERIHQSQGQNLGNVAFEQLNAIAGQNGILPTWLTPDNIKTLLNHEVLQRPIELDLIVSQPDANNRGKLVPNPIVAFARQHGVAVFQPERINKSFEEFQSLVGQYDISIVASFGQIIAQKVLDTAAYGFVNWHPSRLPQFRGPTPMNATLVANEDTSALSWIQMSKDMDAGDIILQLPLQIERSWTYPRLAMEMSQLGQQSWALVCALQVLHKEGLLAFDFLIQNHESATFTQMLSKEMALVDRQTFTAQEIYNFWRANLIFPGTKIVSASFAPMIKLVECHGSFSLEKLKQLESEIEIVYESLEWLQIKQNKQTRTFLKCAQGSLLEVTKIILMDGKSLDFRGYQFKP